MPGIVYNDLSCPSQSPQFSSCQHFRNEETCPARSSFPELSQLKQKQKFEAKLVQVQSLVRLCVQCPNVILKAPFPDGMKGWMKRLE